MRPTVEALIREGRKTMSFDGGLRLYIYRPDGSLIHRFDLVGDRYVYVGAKIFRTGDLERHILEWAHAEH
jgi:hypothetical protein